MREYKDVVLIDLIGLCILIRLKMKAEVIKGTREETPAIFTQPSVSLHHGASV